MTKGDNSLELKTSAGNLAALGHSAAPIHEGGIRCTKCGCKHWNTTKTVKTTEAVRRYKACRNCGHKIRTQETPG